MLPSFNKSSSSWMPGWFMVICGCLLCLLPTARAQTRTLDLVMLPVQVNEKAIGLGLKIEFKALVEIYVYDLDTVQVMNTSRILEPGQHYIPVKREGLLPGFRYLYSFYYKGRKYFGQFQNPA